MDHILHQYATDIIIAYINNNQAPVADIPALIKIVYQGLLSATTPAETVELTPAVPIKKSVAPDFIVCLEDGKKCKMLKRHLTNLGMTPDQYRAKWGLPDDYPMVAPNYAKARSDLAVKLGLGRYAGNHRTAVLHAVT